MGGNIIKKEYLIGAGLVGATIGFMVGTNIALKKCKETINKEVKDAINKEVKNNVIQELNIKELKEEVKKEAIDKVASSIEQKTDEKLKEFNERLEVMEDIDAKKLDLGKAAVVGLVTISTTLIKAIYDNRNNKTVNENALNNIQHNFELVNERIVEGFTIANNNFLDLSQRVNDLEVK